MESVRLSPRLMLMLICMEDTMDMVLDTADTMVMVLVLDTATTESVKLSPRLMLMLICMEDTMDMVLDMPDTMDIPMVDIPTLVKLFPLIQNGQPTNLVFFISDHIFST